MLFTLVDVLLIILLMIFIIGGFVLGLIQAVGALIGVIIGAWAAGQYYLPLAGWLQPMTLGSEITAKIIAFIVIFLIINRLVAFLFWIVNKAFNLISIIPFLKSINKMSGAILGFVEGVLVLGLIVYVIAKFAVNVEWVANSLDGSRIAHLLVISTSFMTNLLPDIFDKMTGIF